MKLLKAGAVLTFAFAVLNLVLFGTDGHWFSLIADLFCLGCTAWQIYCILDIQRMDREAAEWRNRMEGWR